jgi:Ca2+-binding EF-hand superfamily protein
LYKALGFEEMALLLQETNFNSLAIKNWHKAFYSECPSGKEKIKK